MNVVCYERVCYERCLFERACYELVCFEREPYQTRLASLQNYHFPRMKMSLCQLSFKILVPEFGLIFLKIWNLSRLINLQNNIKTSCNLVKILLDFRFMLVTFL